ncbi:cytochrome P450 [Colletotrichum graminicola]|uniref:Cytochrome P450 n=1 Tax=Colletotrichum graminicola (strain M1.001 / M2 / FGSC 10212) TaxID=645133 RepID=E3Q472_COLGM|nr:cytochrome P450 [Colletotrichum graminicola M1.001]EFQ25384.1 cytochrome P450 [Colletotrichum graminicola M1.001]WDK11372.1 cytochrome P450 [Colletotrichum graminicola]
MAITMSFGQALCLFMVLTTIYIASYIIYNLFLHPLRRFPGPLAMRATRATYCYRLWRGKLSFDMLELHRRYGDVVRIAPDELAFANPSAWKDIMGHRTAGGVSGGKALPEFEKADSFYRPLTELPRDIISAEGSEHAMLRKQLSPGFSERSLREQEPVIMKYVDLFIQKMREAAKGCQGRGHGDGDETVAGKTGNQSELKQEHPVDLTLWYNYVTFDIIGDLAFSESFGCLEGERLHPWVKTLFLMVRTGVALQTAAHFPMLRRLLTVALSTRVMRERMQNHMNMTMQKLVRRVELGEREGPQNDLIEALLKKRKEWGFSLRQVDSNGSIIIIAGSETTATLLSGVTYLLLKNPEKMRKLVREVRAAFEREEEINLKSVNSLTYMLACIDEAMRIYPPVPTGLPRTVPEGGATILGQFIPEEMTVSIHQWAMYHNEKNFKDPFVFHPERFLGDPEYASDRREAFQPFHIGSRNCLGRSLAYFEMRIVMAKLLWNFDLELAEDSEEWMETQKIYTIWEKGPLNVYLQPVARG